MDSSGVGSPYIFIVFSIFFSIKVGWQDPLASGCHDCAQAFCSFPWAHKEYYSMAMYLLSGRI